MLALPNAWPRWRDPRTHHEALGPHPRPSVRGELNRKTRHRRHRRRRTTAVQSRKPHTLEARFGRRRSGPATATRTSTSPAGPERTPSRRPVGVPQERGMRNAPVIAFVFGADRTLASASATRESRATAVSGDRIATFSIATVCLLTPASLVGCKQPTPTIRMLFGTQPARDAARTECCFPHATRQQDDGCAGHTAGCCFRLRPAVPAFASKRQRCCAWPRSASRCR